MTLSEMLHIRQVSAFLAVRSDVDAAMTPAQQAKLDAIAGLLVEVGEPTLDEELDATIAELTDIRDRP
jgi:wyosine [tRNA(Phe)-imidazoG37] synthetase (radical SAM superfamily)